MRYAWDLLQGRAGLADEKVLSLIHRWMSRIQYLRMFGFDGAVADVWSALQFRCDSTVVPHIYDPRLVNQSPVSSSISYLMNPNIRCVLSETRH